MIHQEKLVGKRLKKRFRVILTHDLSKTITEGRTRDDCNQENERRKFMLNNVFVISVKSKCKCTTQKKGCEQLGLAARLEPI